jgi:MFS-type transporter involved in bile tolerance (Atg22 family)
MDQPNDPPGPHFHGDTFDTNQYSTTVSRRASTQLSEAVDMFSRHASTRFSIISALDYSTSTASASSAQGQPSTVTAAATANSSSDHSPQYDTAAAAAATIEQCLDSVATQQPEFELPTITTDRVAASQISQPPSQPRPHHGHQNTPSFLPPIQRRPLRRNVNIEPDHNAIQCPPNLSQTNALTKNSAIPHSHSKQVYRHERSPTLSIASMHHHRDEHLDSRVDEAVLNFSQKPKQRLSISQSVACSATSSQSDNASSSAEIQLSGGQVFKQGDTSSFSSEETAWAFHGAARSPFLFGLAAFFSPYVTLIARTNADSSGKVDWFGLHISPTSFVAVCTTIAAILTALLAPLLGAAVGFTPHRKRILCVVNYTGAAAGISMITISESSWKYSIIHFVIAVVCYELTLTLIYSYLPEISASVRRRSRVSALGVVYANAAQVLLAVLLTLVLAIMTVEQVSIANNELDDAAPVVLSEVTAKQATRVSLTRGLQLQTVWDRQHYSAVELHDAIKHPWFMTLYITTTNSNVQQINSSALPLLSSLYGTTTNAGSGSGSAKALQLACPFVLSNQHNVTIASCFYDGNHVNAVLVPNATDTEWRFNTQTVQPLAKLHVTSSVKSDIETLQGSPLFCSVHTRFAAIRRTNSNSISMQSDSRPGPAASLVYSISDSVQSWLAPTRMSVDYLVENSQTDVPSSSVSSTPASPVSSSFSNAYSSSANTMISHVLATPVQETHMTTDIHPAAHNLTFSLQVSAVSSDSDPDSADSFEALAISVDELELDNQLGGERMALMAFLGVWWALLSIMTFRYLGARPQTHALPDNVNSVAYAAVHRLIYTIRAAETTSHRHIFRFLGGVTFYAAGTGGLIAVLGPFLQEEALLTPTQIAIVLLTSQTAGIFGAFAFYQASKRFSVKPSLAIIVIGWIVVPPMYALVLHRPRNMLLATCIGGVMGMFVGGGVALLRAFYASMIGMGQESEFMGLFSFANVILQWLGTLLFTIVNEATGNMPLAMASISSLFVIALLFFMVSVWSCDVVLCVLEIF